MVEILIADWLEEYNSLSESEIRSFAIEQEHNNEVVIALYTVFEEQTKYSNFIDPVCSQLFRFHRSSEEELRQFALQFVPALILLYLENVTHSDRSICRSVETLLIGIYNLEIVNKSGKPEVFSFRIPPVAQASVYHEPAELQPEFLTEKSLKRWEECNSKLVNWGPLPQIEYLNAQNRLRVMTALLFIYNRQLARLSNTSLENLCKVSSKLVTQGFHSSGSHVRLSIEADSSHISTLPPRIALSSELLLELLHSIYYATFDGNVMHASQALDDIYNRASYEFYTDVLLVANGIKNLVHISRSGISDGIMNVNLVHSTSTPVPVSKSMITNASFRTKKLPDDIPIQVTKEETDPTGLVSIMEEKEEEEKTGVKTSFKTSKESSSALAGMKNLPKTISGLGKKVKESKVVLKYQQQSPGLTDKEKDGVRRSIEMEKDLIKYVKEKDDTTTISSKPVDEIEFKRIVTDTEKVSLVSDSIKSNGDDNVTENGDVSIENYNENITSTTTHNAIHVSSV